MKITITTTTINVPYLLEDYIKDAIKFGHNNVDFIIAGDKKTPDETPQYCKELGQNYSIPVTFMDCDDQNSFLATSFPQLKSYLPWNCIQRRQVAILKAYSMGSDLIVLIDDDNYIACDDYIGKTLRTGKESEYLTVSTQRGWYNICEDLEDRHGRKFFPRGYSVDERGEQDQSATWSRKSARSVVTAGFWLGDPDIDAVTRLSAPIDVVSYNRNENYALDSGVFSPFNSQNTTIHRDIVPAYFLVPEIGRFDDIWASYIVERVAWEMGDVVTYGQPLVRQNRNEHDLWADAYAEEMGTKLTPFFCNMLRSIPLSAKTYGGLCAELCAGMKHYINNNNLDFLTYDKRAYLNHFIDGYNIYLKSLCFSHIG